MSGIDPPDLTPAQQLSWHDVASEEEVPDDLGLSVRVGDHGLALFKENGRIYAVEDFCPHQGGLLSGGLVREGLITCPLHAWQFRLTDGCNVDSGPGIKAFQVRIEAGRVKVLA